MPHWMRTRTINVCSIVGNMDPTCNSTYFSTNGASYHRLCGRARGYQKGLTYGLNGYKNRDQTTIIIDDNYAGCLSITYGNSCHYTCLMLLDGMTTVQIRDTKKLSMCC